MRNLKAVGFALIAVLATSAMLASAAPAASFDIEKAPASIKGEETTPGEFLITGTGVRCAEVSFSGLTATTSESQMTLVPTYTECKTSLETAATVTGFGHAGEANKCHYVFKADGKVDLACTGGAEVTITAANCQVHIPAQNNIGSIIYDTGVRLNKHDLKLTLNITNIVANHTDKFLCPFNGGSGNASSMTLKGDVTLWAESPPGTPVHLTHTP